MSTLKNRKLPKNDKFTKETYRTLKLLKISVMEMSRWLGLSRQTLLNWESNKRVPYGRRNAIIEALKTRGSIYFMFAEKLEAIKNGNEMGEK